MITITSNAGQVAGRLRQINIPNATFNSLRVVSKEGEALAKMMSPMKTGSLRTGIVAIVINKDRAKIVSSVAKMFPYNFWVNQQPGYVTLRYPKGLWLGGRKVLSNGGSATYGSVPAHWRWTGLPRYFTRTFNIVQQMFFRTVVSNVRKELIKG